MKVTCRNCGAGNMIPDMEKPSRYRCWRCHTQLPADNSRAAEGAVAGAAIGALIAGPGGAVVGALIGALLGDNAKS